MSESESELSPTLDDVWISNFQLHLASTKTTCANKHHFP
jgi:hypothetical protein